VCRDPARSAEVEESFKDSRKTKLRRDSAFVHRAIAARSAGSQETLQGFTVPKLRRESIFKNAGETKDTGFTEKQRPRPLILWKYSKEEEEAEAQEGATVVIDSELERKIWTVEVSRPGGSRRAQHGRERSGPSDLEQIADSHRIWEELAHEI
jgi:hypothetical protein